MNTEKTVADDLMRTIKKVGIDGTTLKWIALITMIIDHAAAVFLNHGAEYTVLRAVGRLSFPIFAFLITQGYRYTSDRRKYALRLFVFAIISEIPYDLAFYNEFVCLRKQNIFFSLLLGLIAIRVMDYITGEMKMPQWITDKRMVVLVQSGLQIATILIICYVAARTNLGYSYVGILLIVLYHSLRESKYGITWANVLFAFMYGGIQLYGLFAIIPLTFYNGKPGNRKYKWLFYAFYPAHLLVLWVIHRFLV